jgi:hypothetical protein
MLCKFPERLHLVIFFPVFFNGVAANDGLCNTIEAVEKLGNVKNTI